MRMVDMHILYHSHYNDRTERAETVHKYVNIFHKWQFRTWDGGYMTKDDEHGVSGVEFA